MSRESKDNRNDRVNREDEMREECYMGYFSPFSVVDKIREEGKSYRFARKSILGQNDYRVEELAMQGWVPVSAEKIPGAFKADPLGRNPMANDFYCYKDTILMERPEIYSEREREQLRRKNIDIIRNLRGVSDDYYANVSPFRTVRS
jgi:hypothetical protein